MLGIDDTAPAFTLPDQHGAVCSLDDLLTAGAAIVFFYPADFTPVCTREACAFRDSYQQLQQIAVPVVGISPQSSDSHQRFATAFDLPFPLLADPGKTVIREFGVNGLLGFGVRRVTYLIGASRRIESRVVADFFVGRHVNLLRKVIEARSRQGVRT